MLHPHYRDEGNWNVVKYYIPCSGIKGTGMWLNLLPLYRDEGNWNVVKCYIHCIGIKGTGMWLNFASPV